MPLDDDIVRVLRSVADPEVGLNIVDLGLVYGALWASDGIRVLMTMTSASCPMADMLTIPLSVHFEARYCDKFSWLYLERGPDVWRVRIGRTG